MSFMQDIRDRLQDTVLEHNRYATIEELAKATGQPRKKISQTIYHLRKEDFLFCPPAGGSGDAPRFDSEHRRQVSTVVRRLCLARPTGAPARQVRTGDEARRQVREHGRNEAFWLSVRGVTVRY